MLRAHARALIVTASGAELITLLSRYSRGKQAESVCVCEFASSSPLLSNYFISFGSKNMFLEGQTKVFTDYIFQQ